MLRMLRVRRAVPRPIARLLCLLAAAGAVRLLLGDGPPWLRLLQRPAQFQPTTDRPAVQTQPPQQVNLRQGLEPLPRLIHVTAHSELLRVEYRPVLRQWTLAQPELQIRLWRDVDTECLLRRSYPDMLADYRNQLQTPLERSDLIRILALHSMGGLYVDLDTEPVKNISFLFTNPLAGAMIAQEPEEHAVLLYNRLSLLSNAVMFSAPGHQFYLFYARQIFENLRKPQSQRWRRRNNYAAPQITGPLVMQAAYEAFQRAVGTACRPDEFPARCQVHLFAPKVFSPRFDLSQRATFRSTCLKWRRRQLMLKRRQQAAPGSLDERKTAVCNRLFARGFTVGSNSNATLAVHLFRHLTTSGGSALGARNGRRRRGWQRQTRAPARAPPVFNASAEFPQLRMLAKELGSNCGGLA